MAANWLLSLLNHSLGEVINKLINLFTYRQNHAGSCHTNDKNNNCCIHHLSSKGACFMCTWNIVRNACCFYIVIWFIIVYTDSFAFSDFITCRFYEWFLQKKCCMSLHMKISIFRRYFSFFFSKMLYIGHNLATNTIFSLWHHLHSFRLLQLEESILTRECLVWRPNNLTLWTMPPILIQITRLQWISVSTEIICMNVNVHIVW